MSKFKFATYTFAGKPHTHYLVEERVLTADVPKKQPVGHHIVVVDESGSMYGDISGIKEKLRKVLTLDEYGNSTLLVTLMGYASSGDLAVYFERVPVADIVKSKNTKAQRAIGSLHSRGMTCMTQAFAAALKLAQAAPKGEVTAVSLHSDGYFNDPSPSAEFREVDRLVGEFKKLDNVFVNTIAYRSSSDFTALAKIANALSGKCFQALDLKSYYDAIYDASELVSGKGAPALVLEKKGSFDYQVFVSSDGKIVGGAGDLTVSGVAGDAMKRVYEFKEVDQKKFDASKDSELPIHAELAFARAQLAEGRVSAAKFAVAGARANTLLAKHARALTGSDLAAFAADLETSIATLASGGMIDVTAKYGLSGTEATVPAVLAALSEHRDDFALDVSSFLKDYRRRGLKRLSGKWENGRLLKPAVRTELRDKDAFVPVSGFDFNRNNATINMTVKQPCRLMRVKDGSEIKELGGIKLDLTDYKQYTLVGDGAVNAPLLKLKLTNKRLHKKLTDLGAVSGAYDPKSAVEVDLGARPLVEYDAGFDPKAYAGLAERLATLHTADKLFGALVKEKSSELSGEQVEELKACYVTPSLYVSMPTTNPYEDLKAAIGRGEVDARLSYEVLIGSPEMLNPSDLRSANEFLRRWYECSAKAIKDPKKVTMGDWFEPDFKVTHKKLSAKVKVTADDKIMAKVFDEFFGLASTGLFNALFGPTLSTSLYSVARRKQVGEDAIETLTTARKAVGKALDELYRTEVSPLVFYVGASGLLPDAFGEVPALSADQLAQKYPSASPDKAMRESGAFYDVGGDTIITVLTESAYYSTALGLEAAKAIEDKAVAALA